MEKGAIFSKYRKSCLCFLYCFIVYVGVSKENLRGFLKLCKPSSVIIGMLCDRLFYKFP